MTCEGFVKLPTYPTLVFEQVKIFVDIGLYISFSKARNICLVNKWQSQCCLVETVSNKNNVIMSSYSLFLM